MLDCAATSSAVLLETIDSINGKIFERPCKLSTFDKCESSSRDFANFKILPLDRSFTLEVENALVGTILTTERDRPPRNSQIVNIPYDGEHPETTLSVSTGVKIVNSMRVKIKKINVINHNKYFIAKFAFK